MKKKRNSLVPIIFICILLVPLIYSGFYLAAFWDPYNTIDQLPVAVVNNDKGAVINGIEKNVGQELSDKLKDEKPLDITFTDEVTAKAGTDGTRFYATITIPEDFSSNIASASEKIKKQAVIQFTQNEKKNYLAVTILKSAISEIQKSVVSSVNEEIVTNLSDQLREVPDKMTELDDGLGKLKKGTTKLYNGTDSLKEGTDTLKNGMDSLASGVSELNLGASKLGKGGATLNSGASNFQSKFAIFSDGVKTASTGSEDLKKGATALNVGIDSLLKGANKLDTSTKDIKKLSDGAAQLAVSTQEFNKGISAYTEGVNVLITTLKTNVKSTSDLFNYLGTTNNKAVLEDPQVQSYVKTLSAFNDPQSETSKSIAMLEVTTQEMKEYSKQITEATQILSNGTASLPELKQGITQLKKGLEASQKGAAALEKGSNNLRHGMRSLDSAATKLNEGAFSLATGADELNKGAKSLATGAKKLNSGTNKLADGVTDLQTGVNKLNTGAGDLKTGIEEAETKVSNSIKDTNEQLHKLDGLDNYAADPVNVQKSSYNVVANYGTSFTPYFMSLSLWVGALLALMGIYYDVDSKFKRLSRIGSQHVFRCFAYMGIGVLQAVILSVALILILGLKVQEFGLYFVASLVVSLTFTAIVQFLLVYFKDIGKFVSVILLILQLCSCGGTFPLELVPTFFQKISPFLPMTYSVALFREVTCGNTTSFAWKNIGILGIYFMVFMGSILICSIRHDMALSKNNESDKKDTDTIFVTN